MPATMELKFNCPKCRREFRWKPELAGKQAKCKCGSAITVPKSPPPPPAAAAAPVDESFGLDGLYALAAEEKKATARLAAAPPEEQQQGYRCPSCATALPVGATVCPNCNLDMKTGRRPSTRPGAADGIASASKGFVTGRSGAKPLPMKGGKYAAPAKPQGFADFSVNRDVYLPLGLIAAGIILYIVQVQVFGALEGAADEFGRMFFLVNVIGDVVILFVAMLFALRMLDRSAGLGITVLKFVAVALVPGALGEIVAQVVGKSNGTAGLVAGAVVALGGYWGLAKVLFNLDSSNSSKLVFMIYIVRKWGKTLIFFVFIVVVIGMVFKKASEGGLDSKTDSEDVQTPDQTLSPAEQAKVQDTEAVRTLKEDGFSEARAWLKADPKHVMFNLGDKTSETVEALYAMGATNVSAGAAAEGPGGNLATALVIELPVDPVAREKLFAWANETERKLQQDQAETIKDVGQKYIVMNYDNS